MAYVVIDTVLLCVLSAECFRFLQGANYIPKRGYFKILLSWYFAALAVAQAAAVLPLFTPVPRYVASIVYGVCAAAFVCIKRKSPLKLTKRILRMWTVQLAILFVLCYFDVSKYCVAGLPLIALLSLAICLPLDVSIARHYVKKAQKKLASSNVTVVAVTGSYGKTTVKDMLTSLLDDAVCPKGSCNTPLGIAAFINKTDLYYVKYLVLEFGARNRGDIAELCKLYKPKYGIVTGVCPQHLSTFKTFENVVAAKRELVENLPENGVCILNFADETASSFEKSGVCDKILSNDGLQVKTLSVSVEGTTLAVKRGKTEKQVLLPQITSHVGETFAMCLQACLTLKQSFTQTLKNAVNVKQTPHRMEISKAANCYIIDDGYNGSITGVKSAAKTLACFNQFKTVITQGLVECGKKRRELNAECGKILGEQVDVAIVLGANKKYLAEGLSKTHCKIIFAKNLKQAVTLAQPYLNGENSILMFQNDLPDF